MRMTALAGALAALMSSGAAYAQDATATAPMAPATAPSPASAITADQYVAMAASSDMFEIQSSELALQTSKSKAVQEFAQHMVSDHSMTTKEVMAAAAASNVPVPTAMMPKHADMLERLKATDAATFDAAYLAAQDMAHQEAVALHSAYAESGDDPALKAVAAKAVPIVTEHYEHVSGIEKKA